LDKLYLTFIGLVVEQKTSSMKHQTLQSMIFLASFYVLGFTSQVRNS